MIFNEFQDLVDKAGSRYGLVIAVTKRARDLKDGEMPLTETNPKSEEKSVSVATREFVENKVLITTENK